MSYYCVDCAGCSAKYMPSKRDEFNYVPTGNQATYSMSHTFTPSTEPAYSSELVNVPPKSQKEQVVEFIPADRPLHSNIPIDDLVRRIPVPEMELARSTIMPIDEINRAVGRIRVEFDFTEEIIIRRRVRASVEKGF